MSIGYDEAHLKTKALSGGSRISAEGVSIALHAGILNVLLAIEVGTKDFEGFFVNILVVMVLEIVYLLHSISLFNMCGIDVHAISVTCIFFANLQYLPSVTVIYNI
jgi:hypothetical protein